MAGIHWDEMRSIGMRWAPLGSAGVRAAAWGPLSSSGLKQGPWGLSLCPPAPSLPRPSGDVWGRHCHGDTLGVLWKPLSLWNRMALGQTFPFPPGSTPPVPALQVSLRAAPSAVVAPVRPRPEEAAPPCWNAGSCGSGPARAGVQAPGMGAGGDVGAHPYGTELGMVSLGKRPRSSSGA